LDREHATKKLQELKIKRDKLLKEEQLANDKILRFERQNKSLFLGHEGKDYLGPHGTWRHNSLQKEAYRKWLDPGMKILTLTGANRITKSFTSFQLIMAAIRGQFAWEDPALLGHHWQILDWEPPIKVRWVGQDWEKHIKTTLEPKIDELLPLSWGFEPKKNNVGIRATWIDPKTGGSIEIMTNKSESDIFEGWNGHLIVYDEPPKRDNRVACARGLIDTGGREIFAMTLLKEAWVDTEVINMSLPDGSPDPSVWNINADISVNIGFGITQAGVDQFKKTLNSDEISARIDGVPSYKSGLILKIDKNKHFIKRFEIPAHWMIDISIDIGLAKGHDILYMATASDGYKYVCFEEKITGNGDAIADSIIKKIQRYKLRVNRVICDPLAKSDRNNENTVWEKIEMALMRVGIYLELGGKEKEDAIILLNENLLWTINGNPVLFFFRDLPITTRQVSNWMWADPELMKTGEKVVKASKKDEDMCENLYRLALLETRYEEPFVYQEQSDYNEKNKNPFTGY